MDGTILYDVDDVNQGKNVLEDTEFNDLTSFKTACNSILAGDSGKVTYSFYSTGTETLVEKVAWWKTVSLHGNAWKIVWSEEK